MQRRHLLTYIGAASGALALALFAGWWQVDGPGAPEPVAKRPLPLTEMDFQMTDQTGTAVGPESLLGNASMVFFGFTYCPDVCPTTLSDISSWLDDLGEDVAQLNVVFITIDPKRDTVAAMAEYVSYFHPAIQGWRGSRDQTMRAAEGFRASYEKVATGGGDYTMNHTASVFMFDAEDSLPAQSIIMNQENLRCRRSAASSQEPKKKHHEAEIPRSKHLRNKPRRCTGAGIPDRLEKGPRSGGAGSRV